jgi:hypothetical protein
VKFCIDEPTCTSVARPTAWIRGWCFDEGGLPVAGVRARVGRRGAFLGSARLHRPDVRRALQGPPESEWSGFSVPVRLAPGCNQVRIEARIGATGWVEFHRMELRTPWLAAALHAAHMARYLPMVLLGRPAALRQLPGWEQEAVLARIEQRGGHALSTDPRYPPRNPVLERFPRGRWKPERLPKVTVVTPSYQQARFVEATLRSVLGQEGVRLDYIVRDGGSTDGSADVIARYASRLKGWASEPDGGQASAVQRGFAGLECGPDDVMAYLNSDDLLMPGAVRFVAETFARHPEVDVVYGHRVLVDEAGFEIGRWFTPRRSCFDLRIHDFVPQETLFWRKRIWDRVCGIDARFQFSADWDLLLRFAEAGANFRRLPWFLGLFRRHPAQKTATQATDVGARERDELRRRSLGRAATLEEVDADMKRAQVESAFLASLWRRGWRL